MDDSINIIDKLLSDEHLFKLIELDLSKRYQNTTKTGRKSTPVEVILRMLALKHLRALSYEKTIATVKESLVLRKFCRIYFHSLPNKSTLIRWSNQICQQTLEQFNQRLTQIATDLHITKGKKIRTDGTVVCANIHFPSDNSLLVDGVKVISRLLLEAKKLLLQNSININSSIFRNRYPTARRISRQIDSLSKTRNKSGSQQRKQAYSKLIEVTKLSFKQATKIILLLKNINNLNFQNLLNKIEMFLTRIQMVIGQTVRRVLNQEKVPASEKIVSIFEPHTDIIC